MKENYSVIALVMSVSLFAIEGNAQDSSTNKQVLDENGKPS
jgi:hypothetical protein